MTFNHNDHYHGFLLDQVPPACRRSLDVGCGSGTFARLLGRRCAEVDAVDRSAEMISLAQRASEGVSNVSYLLADIRELDLGTARYDFIACIASVHHLPFESTLERLRRALSPGGVLAILGLSRPTVTDYLVAAVAAPANLVRRAAGGRAVPGARAPIADPDMTLGQIRRDARRLLPGARIRRHLYWRYSLVYRRP